MSKTRTRHQHEGPRNIVHRTDRLRTKAAFDRAENEHDAHVSLRPERAAEDYYEYAERRGEPEATPMTWSECYFRRLEGARLHHAWRKWELLGRNLDQAPLSEAAVKAALINNILQGSSHE